MKAYEDEVRRLWRFPVLCLKANLEAVECGVTTLEEAFLAHMVMPDNWTVGAHHIPDLHHVLTSGKMPKALLDDGSKRLVSSLGGTSQDWICLANNLSCAREGCMYSSGTNYL